MFRKNKLLFALCLAATVCFNADKLFAIPKSDALIKSEKFKKEDLVVAKDGNGDYKTVQSAIDATPANGSKSFIILIKKGVYKELITIPKDKNSIVLKGEDAGNTILTYRNSARTLDANGKELGTFGSASFYLFGDNFTAENITFENTAGPKAGQALAISVSGSKSAFKNCRFLGNQDTFYAGINTIQYFKDCFIAGTVDFIFGASTAFFENCTIHSFSPGYLTAASTPQNQKYGYVFFNCKLTADASVTNAKVYLGRPWRPYSNVVFIKCDMGSHIRPEGWHNWGKIENEKTAFYAEYKSRGEGFKAGVRVSWSKELTSQEARLYTKERVLNGWKAL